MIDIDEIEGGTRRLLEDFEKHFGEDRKLVPVTLGQLEYTFQTQLELIAELRAARGVVEAVGEMFKGAQHYGTVLTVGRDYFRPLEEAIEEWRAKR